MLTSIQVSLYEKTAPSVANTIRTATATRVLESPEEATLACALFPVGQDLDFGFGIEAQVTGRRLCVREKRVDVTCIIRDSRDDRSVTAVRTIASAWGPPWEFRFEEQ